MGFFDKLKRNKLIFIFDSKENLYKAEFKGITFVCEKIQNEYEQYAKDLADNYDNKLSDIIDYILPEITDVFGITDKEIIKNSLGKAFIDLDNGRLSYFEQTLDTFHIIDIEFDGIFETFFYVSIDG